MRLMGCARVSTVQQNLARQLKLLANDRAHSGVLQPTAMWIVGKWPVRHSTVPSCSMECVTSQAQQVVLRDR